jgi:D-amino-acid oxidase
MRTEVATVCFDADVNASSPQPDALVIGAGIIGLVTAWRLSSAGLAVAVWSRDEPQRTTSAVAGAIWYPFLAEPRHRVAKWSAFTLQRLLALAQDSTTGVHLQSVIEVFDHDEPDLWWASEVKGLQRLPRAQVPAGYRAALRVPVPVCDVPVHLQWLVDGLQQRGVVIERRNLSSLDEAFTAAKFVVNCTGLGARDLCSDQELQPVRGQVLQLTGTTVPHAWIDDSNEQPCYVIPRRDSVIIGGTAQVGAEDLAPDAGDSAAILRQAVAAFPQLQDAQVIAERVGLRPYRSTVRLQCEHLPCDRRLVHNYGHGGSGYTLAWGCAEDVASYFAS